MSEIVLEKNVIEALDKGGDLERLKFHLDKFSDSNAALILFSRSESKSPIQELLKKLKKIVKGYGLKTKIEKIVVERIKDKMQQASRSGCFEEVKSKFKESIWVYPLVHGGANYGYICLIIENGKLSKKVLDFIEDYLAISLEKALKELELIKVHGTLRPRAIALSSVHTVHRLISSTLNMDELLPRLARLCLQVTRAKSCAIYLRFGNYLKPKTAASVDSSEKPHKIDLFNSKIGKALEAGTIVLSKNALWVPLIEEDLIGAIGLKSKQNGRPFDLNDKEILSVLSEQAVVAIKNARLYETQNKILIESLQSLSNVLEAKSPEIHTHPKSFIDLVLAIADEYGVSQEEREYIKYATLLLDAGKIAVPENILKKADLLTEREYSSVQEHPIKGAEIIKKVKALKPAVPIILHHHERFDGKGYPKGLKGNKIPLGARILAVADSFEAMICHRPYKKIKNYSSAMDEILKQRGKQFDPGVVDAFIACANKGKIKRISQRMMEEVKKKR
ncbi:MAG: HD domain-containing phosphohydrolase [Candidatus Kaelpia aquatica]|nr:HD domain-containing phosphohydrolase [Candidatus Kaelpia aquatica]